MVTMTSPPQRLHSYGTTVPQLQPLHCHDTCCIDTVVLFLYLGARATHQHFLQQISCNNTASSLLSNFLPPATICCIKTSQTTSTCRACACAHVSAKAIMFQLYLLLSLHQSTVAHVLQHSCVRTATNAVQQHLPHHSFSSCIAAALLAALGSHCGCGSAAALSAILCCS
jgi:hypothetical protein